MLYEVFSSPPSHHADRWCVLYYIHAIIYTSKSASLQHIDFLRISVLKTVLLWRGCQVARQSQACHSLIEHLDHVDQAAVKRAPESFIREHQMGVWGLTTHESGPTLTSHM